ncbi:hypothetical protein R3P38DRAFT_3335637 [Favolaschia claudopus]|uniref:CxC2-like cysteine cluster KDZ transposase-associated domain-containing protein n=1 Tax=Favolaschia claudopus TaxID=2862362 RepID=A0AAV9Z995_9AGAR
MFCQGCIVSEHQALPTHWTQEWNGSFFERRGLKSLGLEIQLGHPVGFRCPHPLTAIKTFTLIDVSGIHNVGVRFCNCDSPRDPQTCATFAVVRLFQLLNCLDKVSSHDFLRSLEFLTNNDGFSPLPDRRRAFRHIVRQYRTTLMMKRAGRGHSSSGVSGTAQGELALQCRACPQPARNLPYLTHRTHRRPTTPPPP